MQRRRRRPLCTQLTCSQVRTDSTKPGGCIQCLSALHAYMQYSSQSPKVGCCIQCFGVLHAYMRRGNRPLLHIEVLYNAGDVRGAGSPMPAELQLIGSEGVSEPILFGDDPDNPGELAALRVACVSASPAEQPPPMLRGLLFYRCLDVLKEPDIGPERFWHTVRAGFARGSHHALQLEVPSELGELLRVVVKQRKPGDSDVGVGW